MAESATPDHDSLEASRMDRWVGAAAIVVIISLVLKLVALTAFLIARRFGGPDPECHEFCFGPDFSVFILWVVAEFVMAIPTMISAAVLLKYIASGNHRLLAVEIPGLLLNAPLWLIASYWLAWSHLR